MDKVKSFKLIKSKNIKKELVIFAFLLTIIIFIGLFINLKYHEYRKNNEKLMSALYYCSEVYNNSEKEEIKEVNKCLNLLKDTKQIDDTVSMVKEMKIIKEYIRLREEINSYIVDGIVKSDINLEKITYFYDSVELLGEKYKNYLLPNLNEIEIQYNKIKLLIFLVNDMYETSEKINLRQNLTRTEYNQSIDAYNDVLQEDIKNEYKIYIDEANNFLTQKERIEAERKRQEQIRNAWVRINVPYISQNLNGVFNGCEAATILMALKYKGYLTDMDLVTYSTNMPKSSDPNTGFYLDIFGKEPKDVAHWIAPAPLVDYAISSSGNNNIINKTGWNLESLSNEILNYNPVVIYLTYDFLEPYNWSNGVPKNLHVLLVTGYNTITEQFRITDPYTRANGNYEFILSKQDIEYLYNSVGMRSIVIR